MAIQITAVHFKADKKLEDFINQKVDKLGVFFEGIIGSEVILKLENTDKPENKTAEVKLNIKGEILYAGKTCETFEEAVDIACEALQKQLIKYKEKLRAK